MGEFRYYLVPQGLVKPDEVPNGWGLLEHRKSRHPMGYYIKVLVEPPERTEYLKGQALSNERAALVSICWRALEAQKLTRPLAIGGDNAEEN